MSIQPKTSNIVRKFCRSVVVSSPAPCRPESSWALAAGVCRAWLILFWFLVFFEFVTSLFGMIYDNMLTPRPEVPLRRKTSKDARRDAREGRNTGPKNLYADADLTRDWTLLHRPLGGGAFAPVFPDVCFNSKIERISF